ncbi:MAG: YtxH domain-containing protein [Polyangiaceae bacterium]
MSSLTKDIQGVGDQVARTATHARGGLVDLGVQVLRFVNNIREAEERGVESILSRLGLQRRQSMARPVLWFAAGAIVAGGAALLFAPMTGEQLLRKLTKAVGGAADEVGSTVKHAAGEVKDKVRDLTGTSTRQAPNGRGTEIT